MEQEKSNVLWGIVWCIVKGKILPTVKCSCVEAQQRLEPASFHPSGVPTLSSTTSVWVMKIGVANIYPVCVAESRSLGISSLPLSAIVNSEENRELSLWEAQLINRNCPLWLLDCKWVSNPVWSRLGKAARRLKSFNNKYQGVAPTYKEMSSVARLLCMFIGLTTSLLNVNMADACCLQ